MRSKEKIVLKGARPVAPPPVPRLEVEEQGFDDPVLVEVRRPREPASVRRARRLEAGQRAPADTDGSGSKAPTEPAPVTMSALVPILWLVLPLVLLVLWTLVESWLFP